MELQESTKPQKTIYIDEPHTYAEPIYADDQHTYDEPNHTYEKPFQKIIFYENY